MAFSYNKSSSNDDYTKFINEMKQDNKKSIKALHKDLKIHKNKWCLLRCS